MATFSDFLRPTSRYLQSTESADLIEPAAEPREHGVTAISLPIGAGNVHIQKLGEIYQRSR